MRPRRVRLGCGAKKPVSIVLVDLQDAVSFNEAEARAPRMREHASFPRGSRSIVTCGLQ